MFEDRAAVQRDLSRLGTEQHKTWWGLGRAKAPPSWRAATCWLGTPRAPTRLVQGRAWGADSTGGWELSHPNVKNTLSNPHWGCCDGQGLVCLPCEQWLLCKAFVEVAEEMRAGQWGAEQWLCTKLGGHKYILRLRTGHWAGSPQKLWSQALQAVRTWWDESPERPGQSLVSTRFGVETSCGLF